MEHTFKIEKELKITTENIVDCVLSCEAGGFDYWGELCSDEKDYEAARQRLAEREKADMKPCYEDVLAEILESGSKLTVYDREDDKDHELTLEKLLNGWKKYVENATPPCAVIAQWRKSSLQIGTAWSWFMQSEESGQNRPLFFSGVVSKTGFVSVIIPGGDY